MKEKRKKREEGGKNKPLALKFWRFSIDSSQDGGSKMKFP